MLILVLSLVLGRYRAFTSSCGGMPNIVCPVPGVLALDRLLSLGLTGFMWLLVMYSYLLRVGCVVDGLLISWFPSVVAVSAAGSHAVDLSVTVDLLFTDRVVLRCLVIPESDLVVGCHGILGWWLMHS